MNTEQIQKPNTTLSYSDREQYRLFVPQWQRSEVGFPDAENNFELVVDIFSLSPLFYTIKVDPDRTLTIRDLDRLESPELQPLLSLLDQVAQNRRREPDQV